jgi:hypothetical protein
MYRFPAIVAIFKTEVQPKRARERHLKSQQREDCLIQTVRQAEQELEQRGIPILIKALAEQAQVSLSVMYYHARVYTIVEQIVQKNRGENPNKEDK